MAGKEGVRDTYLLRPLDLRDIMHEHALNAGLQCNGARITSATAALQLDLHDPVVREPAVLDIATVLHDRWPHARVQQFLDHRDSIRVSIQNARVLRACILPVLFGAEQWLSRREKLHEDRVYLGLDHRPGVFRVLRHRDKVGPVEHGL
jgi:hypothetical protein